MIVDGVAEDRIHRLADHFANRDDLELVGGHADETVGGASILRVNTGGQHVVARNAETRRARFHHPVVGRGHGPEFAALLGQPVREFLHLGKYAGADDFDEKFFRCLMQGINRKAAMHGDHLAAHRLFADFARFVKPVTRQHGVGDLRADQAALDLPVEEVATGVAAPEGAVAIEDGDGQASGPGRSR